MLESIYPYYILLLKTIAIKSTSASFRHYLERKKSLMNQEMAIALNFHSL